jgi:hypothetical protein
LRSGPQALPEFFAHQFERMRAGQFLPHQVEQFENWVFISVLPYAAVEQTKTMVVQPVLELLPNRFAPYVRDQNALLMLAQEATEKNVFYRALTNSPFHLLNALMRDTPVEKVKEICLQTVREGYYLESLSLETKRRLLREERTRIERGMYPDTFIHDLKRLVDTLEREVLTIENQIKKQGSEMEIKGVCQYLAPFSVPEFMDNIARGAAYFQMPSPFSYQPLTDFQQEQIRNLMAGAYELGDMVVFLESQHEHITRAFATYWQSVERDVQMKGELEFSNLFKLAEIFAFALEMSQRFVTGLLNMLSRRLRPAEHSDFECVPHALSDVYKRKLLQAGPDIAKAIYPEHESLSLLYWRYLLQQASALPATTQDQATSGKGPTGKKTGSAPGQEQPAEPKFDYVKTKDGETIKVLRDSSLKDKTVVLGPGGIVSVETNAPKAMQLSKDELRQELQQAVDKYRELDTQRDPDIILAGAELLTLLSDHLSVLGLSNNAKEGMSMDEIVRWLVQNGWVR